MKPYYLRLKGFAPETLPMPRLVAYLKALSDLVGEDAPVHFDRVTKGSARLKMMVSEEHAAAVERNIRQAPAAMPGSSARRGYDSIQQLLAEDKTSGEIRPLKGAVILDFPACCVSVAEPLSIREHAEIHGRIIRLGGKDESIPVTLQTPEGQVVNCTATVEMAKRLKEYLLEPIDVVLDGKARWTRMPSGEWEVSDFRIADVFVLDYNGFSDALADLRAAGSGWDSVPDVDKTLHEIRYGV